MRRWHVVGCSPEGHHETLRECSTLPNALRCAAAWQVFADTNARGLRGRTYTVVEVRP